MCALADACGYNNSADVRCGLGVTSDHMVCWQLICIGIACAVSGRRLPWREPSYFVAQSAAAGRCIYDRHSCRRRLCGTCTESINFYTVFTGATTLCCPAAVCSDCRLAALISIMLVRLLIPVRLELTDASVMSSIRSERSQRSQRNLGTT